MRKLLLQCLFGWLLFVTIQGPLRAATHTVVVSGFSFSPSQLTITNGDTVVWTGLANFHTVSPNEGVAEPFCGSSAPSSCTVTFLSNGTYGYHCIPHRSLGMSGVVTVVPASTPNSPPSVGITTPTNSARFAAPAQVTINATATDNGGVASVQFFANDASLGTDGSAPYSVTASNLAAGVYALTARAVDNLGAAATSAVITITVTNPPVMPPPPLLSLARGIPGSLRISFNTVTGANYILEAASDDFTNWIGLKTNRAQSDHDFHEETNLSLPLRFYRVIAEP